MAATTEEIVQEIKTLKDEMIMRAQETQQLQKDVQSLNDALKEERINRAQSLNDGLKEERAKCIADIQKMQKDIDAQDDQGGK